MTDESSVHDGDREFAPIRDYDIETPGPDEPKKASEAREDENHDELEGDDGAA